MANTTQEDPEFIGSDEGLVRYTNKEFDYTYHPQKHQNLVHGLDGDLVGRPSEWKGEIRHWDPWMQKSVELCRTCGWTAEFEQLSGYTSRLRVEYIRGNRAIWQMGSDWLLRDEPNDCTLGNDYMSQEFLRNKGTTIPLVKMHRFAASDNKFYFTVMSRAKGKKLEEAWQAFTMEQKRSVAQQLGGYIRQWRQFTSSRIQKVDGTQLEDIVVGLCGPNRTPACRKIGYTESEWLDELSPELRRGLSKLHNIEPQDDPELDRLFQELQDSFPRGGPYVFTHADLNLSNIYVDDDARITAILDWESAGFYPWWVELYNALFVPDHFGHAQQLWDMIEQDLSPGYDKENYRGKILLPIGAFRKALDACPVMHDNRNTWTRLPFCECKPYAGWFQERDLGLPSGTGHRMLEKHEEHTPESNDHRNAKLDAEGQVELKAKRMQAGAKE